MNTAFMLMAQYDGKAVIPLSSVARDFFGLSDKAFISKLDRGEIALPVIRMERQSQKSAKGVHLTDLARYIDERREAALKEQKAFARSRN